MNKEKKKGRCRRKGPRGGLLRQTVPCAEASIAGRWLARVADGWNPWHGVLGLLRRIASCSTLRVVCVAGNRAIFLVVIQARNERKISEFRSLLIPTFDN